MYANCKKYIYVFQLLGISTLEERTAQEQALAAEENSRHHTNRDLHRWNEAYELYIKYILVKG
jgi:hypothetical protein